MSSPVESSPSSSSALASYHENKRKMQLKAKRKASLLRLIEISKSESPRIAVGILALIVNSLTNLSFPWMIGKALDNAGAEQVQELVVKSAGVFLAGSAASWLRVYCLGTATENIANKLRSLLFEALLGQDMEFYEKTQLGEIATLLEHDVNTAAELLTDKVAQCLRNCNSAFNGSFMLYKCSPTLCAVSLSSVPLIGIGAMTLSRFSRSITNRLRDSQAAILSYSMERVRNVSTVRLNNRESYELETFAMMLTTNNALAHSRFNAHGSFMSFINFATNAALIAVLRVGGTLIAKGEMTAGALMSFAIQSGFVGLGFSGMSTLYADYNKCIDASSRIFDVVDHCHERKKLLSLSSRKSQSARSLSPAAEMPITLANVSFAYKSRPEFVLNDVSLTIAPRSITCFVGKSGSGKSTLAALLCGLYHPCEGRILYGDELVSSPEAVDTDIASDIFSLFGVVEQNAATLFTGTIASNIEYAKQGATLEEIEDAARAANAHEFIEQFPKKYDTELGANRFMVSGGQAARIALARALIRKPRFLLLDEPTAALDASSEHELIPPLLKLKETTTIIILTHSETMKSIADVVYGVDNGKVSLQ